ncbi:MAG: hypothetical protein RLZZ480_583 [Candidatus Parcubacteria bacterium]
MSQFSTPRERDGWVDDGSRISSTKKEKCPNCGSEKYFQTVSTEQCPSCGLRFDYWGNGGNDVYEAYRQRRAAEAEHRRQAEEEEDF